MVKNKYYAYVTPAAVGVSTAWNTVKEIVTGVKKAQHKSFDKYEYAKNFVFSKLSKDDISDFGLDRNPLYLNKKFVRKAQFIAEKEAKARFK